MAPQKNQITAKQLNKIREFYLRCGSQRKTSAKFGMHRDTLKKLVNLPTLQKSNKIFKSQVKKLKGTAKKISITTILASLDKKDELLTYLNTLEDDTVVNESEVRAQLDIGISRWEKLRALPEMQRYRVNVPTKNGVMGGRYMGSIKAIQTIKNALIIS